LGLAGIAIPDIMNGGAMAVANLASATGESLPNSATTMANAMTIFGISGDQAAATADTMTAALNESSLTLTDFSQGMASAGVMANSVGMSFEQTSAALALFSANGMSGADAGTALRSMLSHMANPTAEAAALFDQLGFSLQEGIESGDLMAYTAGKLETGLAHMSEAERLAALNTMFGADAQRVANILYGEGAEGVTQMTEKMKANGQAQEAARRRLGGLRGAMESLSGSVETAAIVIGSGLTPILSTLAEWLGDVVNWFANLPEPLIRLVSIVAGVIGAMLGLGAAIAGVMAAGSLIPGGFGAVAAAMGTVLGPIALVVAAAAGLYYAFQTNFLGIRDIATEAIDAITSTLGAFGDMLEGLVTGNVQQFFDGMSRIPDALKPVAEFMAAVTTEAMALYDAFARDGITGLLDALPGALSNVGSAFADLGRSIIDGIGNIDWSGLFSRMGEIAGDIWNWLTDQLGRVDWQGAWETALSVLSAVGTWVYNKLGDAISNISTWLVAQVQGVDWQGAFEIAMSVLGAVGSWLVSKLSDASSAIYNWLVEQTGKVDWKGGFQAGMSAISNAGAWIAEKLGNAATDLYNWFKNQFTSVNWSGLATTVTSNLRTAIRDGVQGMLSIATVVFSWLADQIRAVDWNSVGSTFAELLVTGIKGIVGLAGLALWLLGQVLKALAEVEWSSVASAFGTFLLEAIKGLGNFLLGFYGTLGGYVLDLVSVGIPWGEVKGAITSAASGLWDGLKDGLETVLGWAVDLLNEFIRVLNMIPGVNIEPLSLSFDSVGTSAKNATTEVLSLQSVMRSLATQQTLVPNEQARGQMEGTNYTPYSDPYNPAEGGVNLEPQAINNTMGGGGGGIAGIAADFVKVRTEAALTKAELASVQGELGGLLAYSGPVSDFGGVATTTFDTTGTSARNNLQPLGSYVAGMVTGMVNGATPSLNSFLSVGQSVFRGIQAAGTSETNAMQRNVIANAGAMNRDAVAQALAMASGVKTNAAAMNRDATNEGRSMNRAMAAEALGMQVATLMHTLNMQTRSAMHFMTMTSNAKTAASNVRSAMESGMRDAGSAVARGAGQWAGYVQNAAGPMRSAGFAAGAAAGAGIAAGISSMMGAVMAAASAIASAAAMAMNAALSVRSPSRVTRQTGIYTGQGLAFGMLDMRGLVEANARKLAQTAVEAMAVDASPLVELPVGTEATIRHRTLSGGPAAQPIIYNDHRTFTVKVDDLPELVKARDFFDDLERDREMMYGGG
jgi:TP901 family phage tail tape measure protein